MLGQATSRYQVLEGIRQHGVAPGGRKMIDWEDEAAQLSNDTGLYVTWRSSNGTDCTRVGPSSKCFCGHLYKEHSFLTKKAVYPRCNSCNCSAFAFIPQRPEEVGDWWLVRRKGFNVHTWRAKCRCGHGHDEHDPTTRRCSCGCSMFQSNFACLVCDKKWEDHETVFETTQERAMGGRTVGEDYRPLASDKQVQELVFPSGHTTQASSNQPSKIRPAASKAAEKSVQIMHASSGGAIKGQNTTNRWGRVENPPEEWLYHGPGAGLTATIQGGGSSRKALQGAASGSSRTSNGFAGAVVGHAPVRTASAAGSVRHSLAAGIGRSSSTAGRRIGQADGRRTPESSAARKQLSSGFRPVYD